MKVKKGDQVKIIAGDDKGKTGIISKVFKLTNKVLVEGINVSKRHKKGKKQDEKGKIIEISTPIDSSNVRKV